MIACLEQILPRRVATKSGSSLLPLLLLAPFPFAASGCLSLSVWDVGIGPCGLYNREWFPPVEHAGWTHEEGNVLAVDKDGHGGLTRILVEIEEPRSSPPRGVVDLGGP